MIVIDTSVWLDLFLENPERKRLAEALINSIDEKGITIYEPEVFKWSLLVCSRESSKGKRSLDS
jgi:predicted nucleic acid-binding protein